MANEQITNALQENLLVLLAFDDDYAPTIRHSVEPDLFEGVYRDIARAIYDYIDKFGEVPGSSHTSDLFDHWIEDPNDAKSSLYLSSLKNLYQLKEQGVNAEYAMSRLNEFLRRQRLKQAILQSAEIVQNDNPEALDQAENVLEQGMNRSLDLFDPGVRLIDPEFIDFVKLEEEPAFPTGVRELDQLNLGPRRKELWTFIATTGGGKSWCLLNLAKQALLQRQRVVYISLEMTHEVACLRFAQLMFSFSKRPGTFTSTKFERDSLGKVIDFNFETLDSRPSLRDPDFQEWLSKRVNEWGTRLSDKFFIKYFPSGSLTMNGLKAYLNSLERMYQFVPDLILLDYVDEMSVDPSNYRLSLSNIVTHLRGLAGERNLAIATASQSNREGMKNKKIDRTNASESIDKIFTSDVVITLSRTEAEEEKGLARLYVDKARNEQDKQTILISHNYNLGIFCADSAWMLDNYWDILERESDKPIGNDY